MRQEQEYSARHIKAATIVKELKTHAPFTAFGTVTGIVVMAIIVHVQLPRDVASTLF
jgi:hypothetical protein